MPIPPQELAETMYSTVAESMGKRNLKPNELIKETIARFPAGAVTKDDCKQALRLLIDSGRCVYSFYGESYVTLPHREGAANE